MEEKYNLRKPGIRRLMREALELAEPTEDYCANPLEDNLFEWHFTVRGSPNTEFQDGIYHGRIILPTEYPMKPPDIILLTPNGRFETNTKICLSISGHHPETWQPSWTIRTVLVALIAFMPTKTLGAIGALNYSPEERQMLAKRSRNWECDTCGKVSSKLATENCPKPLSTVENLLVKEIAEFRDKEIEREKDKDKGNICEEAVDKTIQKIFEQPNRLEESESVDNLQIDVNVTPLIQDHTSEEYREHFMHRVILVLAVGILALIARRLIMLITNNAFFGD